MRKMTEEMKAAGESQAHLKYLNYAEKAKREGKENGTPLRRRVLCGAGPCIGSPAHWGVGNTAENLHDAICGEGFESDEMARRIPS